MTAYPDLPEEDLFRPPEDRPYIIDNGDAGLMVALYTPDRSRSFYIIMRKHDRTIVNEAVQDSDPMTFGPIPPEEAWLVYRQRHDLPRAREMIVAYVDEGPDGIPAVLPPGVQPYEES